MKTANRAADFAKMFGLQYVVENGGEAFKGNGASTFGTSELFANANSNLGLQPDTGNFFVQRVWTRPEEAQAFIEKYADRVGYIHLKTSSKDHKPQPVAGDNELDHDIIFAIAAKAKMPYVGFELAQPDTLAQAYKNHKKSVEYLKRRFGG